MAQTPSIEFSTKKLSELTAYSNNARTHSRAQVAQIVASIKEFGFTNPVLCNPDGVLIAGHGRLMAAKRLKLKTVPAMVITGLTEAQHAALVLADNKLALNAEWDEDMLAEELRRLSDGGYNIALTGFNDDECAQFLKTGTAEAIRDDDAVPEPPTDPISAQGDVWALGAHKVMCGSATVQTDVDKLMDGALADMVFTDPPYRMNVTGGSNQPIGRSAAKLGEAIKHLCEFDPVAFLATLLTVFNKAKMNAYIFCNKDLVPDYLQWGLTNGFSFNILFWKKPNALPLGGQHRPDVEYLLYFRKGAHWNNGVKEANYSRCMEYGRENSTPHPTMKPVALIENQVLIASPTGGLILDLFGGSGSTLIACEKTHRACRMMELDPRYVDVIVRRWQEYTGKEATLLSTGQTFEEVSHGRKK